MQIELNDFIELTGLCSFGAFVDDCESDGLTPVFTYSASETQIKVVLRELLNSKQDNILEELKETIEMKYQIPCI